MVIDLSPRARGINQTLLRQVKYYYIVSTCFYERFNRANYTPEYLGISYNLPLENYINPFTMSFFGNFLVHSS